jgi:hypothetical protein
VTEDVPKGSGDRPIEDVIIVDSGEVRLPFLFNRSPFAIANPDPSSSRSCQKQKRTQKEKPRRYLFTLSSNPASLPPSPPQFLFHIFKIMNKIWFSLLAQQEDTVTAPTRVKDTSVAVSPVTDVFGIATAPPTPPNDVENLGLPSETYVAHPIRSLFIGAVVVGGVLGVFVWYVGVEKVRMIMANAGIGGGGFGYRKVHDEDLERR